MFRKVLIDACLGAIQPIEVPYKSFDLPLAKITSLCQRLINVESKKIEELKANEMFKDILKATNDAVRFLRMSKLKPENFQLDCNEVDPEEADQNEFAENGSINSESNSSKAGTEDGGTEDEDI